MKVSRGRYGLTIMMDLAQRYGSGPTSLKSIAERHNLSEHYLEQLIAPLRNAGWFEAFAVLMGDINWLESHSRYGGK